MMSTRPSQRAIRELLTLQKMACTSRQFMVEPPPELREAWDGVTASYVEELEQIIIDLEVKSVEALWLMETGEGK